MRLPGYKDLVDFGTLVGKTITNIHGMEEGSAAVRIDTSDGSSYLMWHMQDCCEWVSLEDVVGNPSDLIGLPVAMAEVVHEADEEPLDKWDKSYTWTFYKLATARGYVTLRWYGTSNGYYSEEVYFALVPKD